MMPMRPAALAWDRATTRASCSSVSHDADAGDAELAEAKDVPEAFDDQQTVLLQGILRLGAIEGLLAV